MTRPLDAAALREIREVWSKLPTSDGRLVVELLDALEAAEAEHGKTAAAFGGALGERDALLATVAELQATVANMAARLQCYACASVVVGVDQGHGCKEHGKT